MHAEHAKVVPDREHVLQFDVNPVVVPAEITDAVVQLTQDPLLAT
jgi:hypothetical protein